MTSDESIDLLATRRGTVTAPAGCGKTHLIAQTLARHHGLKPILVLTHTNAGVAALRARLDHARVSHQSYSLSTIDGWAMRLVGRFPKRSGIDQGILKLSNPKKDYSAIRSAAWQLLKGGHVQDILESSYAHLIVDEYQDCSLEQHAIVYYAAEALHTSVLGDPMQAIFGWPGNELADWEKHVCAHFPIIGELKTPWRWINAGTGEFGEWLLEVRRKLQRGEAVDLSLAPPEVTLVHLDGTKDRLRQLQAARTKAPQPDGTVLIIGKSESPQSQRDFASQTPGAVTVEAVDLRDLVEFARNFKFENENALESLIRFAASTMTNVGATDLIKRVNVLLLGTEQKPPSDSERAALRFKKNPCPQTAVNLLVEINKQGGVRPYRPAVLRACIRALSSCVDSASFYDCAILAREQNRLIGRPLPKRAVGSTLLLKGLEADVSVILDAADLDARNFYVAITRGSRKLVICSKDSVITKS